GYDTIDHYRIDPRLGSVDDLRWLVDACHARHIRIVLDGVFNHVGRGFAPFQDVVAHQRASRFAEWFRITWGARPSGPGAEGFAYASFEGHAQLVALNHDLPAVADYVTEVMAHWLDFGIDGWRLDAAYAVPPAFWRLVLDR